jgi:cold shock CspA family protein
VRHAETVAHGRPLSKDEAMPSDREFGTITFFNRSKGYGFTTRDHGIKNVFVSVYEVDAAELPRDPYSGDRISFIGWITPSGKEVATQIKFEKL